LLAADGQADAALHRGADQAFEAVPGLRDDAGELGRRVRIEGAAREVGERPADVLDGGQGQGRRGQGNLPLAALIDDDLPRPHHADFDGGRVVVIGGQGFEDGGDRAHQAPPYQPVGTAVIPA